MGNFDIEISNEYKYKKADYFIILIILILGFLVRIYKINHQSVFFDEYVTVGNFKILDIKNFFYVFFINAPDLGISPLSAIILYYWLNLFQDFDWLWRILPITFGMFTIIITYCFAKMIGGRKVAFLTCILFCLSPFNIWFHQELRCYAFLQFLSLVALYALFKYLYTGQRRWNWFILGAISNLAMPWFHATYVVYPLFQIIIIIINSKISKKTLLWIVQCMISPLLWGMWYMYLSPFIYNTVNPAHMRAGLWDFIVRIFGNDSIGISQELLPEWKTSVTYFKESLWTSVIKNIHLFDYYLMILTIVLLLVFIWNVFNKRNKSHIFLLSSVSIPVLTFILLELIIVRRPIFHPLYFFYVFPLIYISISYVVVNLKIRALSIFIIVTLIFSYVIQCMSLILYKNRTDYKHMTEYIENNAGIGDVVLGQRSTTFWDIGKIYQKRKDIQYISYYTLYQLNKEIEEMLGEHERLWITVETYTLQIIYQGDVIELLTKNLREKNVDIYWKKFPGQYNLYVGQLKKKGQVLNHVNDDIFLVNEGFIKYKELLDDLKITCGDKEMDRKNMELLKEYVLMWPLLPWVNTFVISELIKKKDFTIAEKMCDYLIEKYPEFSDIYLLKGTILLCLGYIKTGIEYIDRAKEKNVILKNYIFSIPSINNNNRSKYFNDFYNTLEKINHEGIMPLCPVIELLFKMHDR